MRTILLLLALLAATALAPTATAHSDDCAKAVAGASACIEWTFAEACITVNWGIVPAAPTTVCNAVPGPAI